MEAAIIWEQNSHGIISASTGADAIVAAVVFGVGVEDTACAGRVEACGIGVCVVSFGAVVATVVFGDIVVGFGAGGTDVDASVCVVFGVAVFGAGVVVFGAGVVVFGAGVVVTFGFDINIDVVVFGVAVVSFGFDVNVGIATVVTVGATGLCDLGDTTEDCVCAVVLGIAVVSVAVRAFGVCADVEFVGVCADVGFVGVVVGVGVGVSGVCTEFPRM